MKPEDRLRNLFDSIEEHILSMSDEDLEQGLRDEGLDPHVEAERIRELLRDVVRKHDERISEEA